MAKKNSYPAANPYQIPEVSRRKKSSDVPAEIMLPRLLLIMCAFGLLLLGLVMVFSASSIAAIDEGVDPNFYLVKQIGFAVVGIAGCILLWKIIPYNLWRGPLIWIAWGAAIVLLVLTAAIGTAELGAQRWLNLGPISLQPAEFSKIAFVLVAAKILADLREGAISLKGALVQGLVMILIPLMFLYRTQSDLGTTLICFVAIVAVMWLAEIPLKVILGVLAAGAILAALASMVGYRADRMVFLDPWSDYYGKGYQLIHSLYAFSEGGLLGVGLGNSREKFLYLPEAETDFIYAIIGEELGLIGALGVVVVFVLLLYAGLRIAQSAPDDFGRIIAGGFTVMLVFQAFLNIGCVIGILPTTGKPLPFISSGGSSLIACLWTLGLILAVSRRSQLPDIHEQRRFDLRVIRAQRPEPHKPPTAQPLRQSAPAYQMGGKMVSTEKHYRQARRQSHSSRTRGGW